MPDHIYKVVDLVGTSTDGIDNAIRNAVDRASQTIKALDWFEVTEIRGHIENGQVAHFQVSVKVGFRVLEPQDLQQS